VIEQFAQVAIVAVQELEQALTVLRLPGRRWRPIGFD
jgi:predicted flap endonuclease-1-like 5' DNA nuclease